MKEDFNKNLIHLLDDLINFTHMDCIIKCRELFPRLNNNRIIAKYLELIRPFAVELNAQNEAMFSNPLCILPGVDLSIVWERLNAAQKTRCWTHLQLLYSTGLLIIDESVDIMY